MKSICPHCDNEITLDSGVVESERIVCSECNNAVVVSKIENGKPTLIAAPEVEEDWGE